MKRVLVKRVIAGTLIGISTSASLNAQTLDYSQPVDNLREAVVETVKDNPDVRASWFAFEQSKEEQRAAKGGYYPSVDIVADTSRISSDTPVSSSEDYNRHSARFTITQMLFDGFATRDEVKRLRFSKLASYYRLRETSEDISLEVAVAYLDVYRYQNMVALAEKNYVAHRTIYDQIEERTSGGVSRGVDLEQANARLALSESNLLTEMTNLHDVRVRFQRLTNLWPADKLTNPALSTALIPGSRVESLVQAYNTSPLLNAAIEDVRATQEELNSKNAPMMPRFDLRFRSERENYGEDINSRFEGDYDETAVELVMTYNLYRGGSDSANKRRLYKRLDQARELQIKACRDVRQNVIIAYNNIGALQEQLLYADRNQLAISKARVAYQGQFDLGQRTLLDQLDTENEFFDANRALVNAEADLVAAQARTLAKMGVLLAAIEVDDLGVEARKNLNLDRERDSNGLNICPMKEVPMEMKIDKEALFSGLMSNNGTGRAIRTVSNNTVMRTATASTATLTNRPTGVNAPRRITSSYGRPSGGGKDVRLNVNFAHNSSEITGNYGKAISDAVDHLNKNPDAKAVVEGHTDSTGPEEYNQKLSERRANTVREEILKTNSTLEDRLEIKGYGELAPIASNDTADGRERNRRSELVLEKTDEQ